MKTFLTGLGIGIGLGVLFAPDKGEATRSKLRDRIGDWSETFTKQVDNVKEKVANQADLFANRIAGADEEGENRPTKKAQARAESDQDPINTLSREQLMSVNGIGPVLAERIISGRPYSSTRELVDHGIIAQSTFDELERQFGRRLRHPA